jgi:phosphoribosyl-ATP pyrophosphohydrolase/phosphoribosyl-AMP cyclohydrolase
MGTRDPRPLEPTAVRYGPDGLVAAVVQDADDGRVLMVAWQDAEALAATLATGEAHFHSRSRDALWKKGESSGNTLAVISMELDCDGDAVLIRARPAGPTCHTEARSCFDREPMSDDELDTGAEPEAAAERRAAAEAGLDSPAAQDFAWLERLWAVIEERARTRPEGSYTSRLLTGGVDAVARKVSEEANEVVMAAKDDDFAERSGAGRPHDELAGELADLLYHSLVLCAERGLPPSVVIDALKERHKA